jgi:hypothetical protein
VLHHIRLDSQGLFGFVEVTVRQDVCQGVSHTDIITTLSIYKR